MIKVRRQPEPDNFNSLVRQPGRKFLRAFSRPTSKQFITHGYWRRILEALHDAYSGICAYSCHWIPYDTGADTVEHFRAKKKYPKDAYEWDNYRLVCATLNGRKGDHEDVLDPFLIRDGDFILKFPSLLVVPSPELAPDAQDQVQKTIDRLQLNDEGTCLKSRLKWLTDYCSDDITFNHLQNHAPFVAMELRRQNLVDAIKMMMRPGSTP